MAYSDFTFERIESELQLSLHEADLFSRAGAMEPGPILEAILKENIPLGLSINTEKARSELLISPVLVELRKMLAHRISLFSGLDFNIDLEKGLTGVCDFLISASSTQILPTAPVIQIVEAKNENIRNGIPQCIAGMCAARIFNERKDASFPTIYGTVTTGSSWKFLQLDGSTVTIDSMEYFIGTAGKILGILRYMVERATS